MSKISAQLKTQTYVIQFMVSLTVFASTCTSLLGQERVRFDTLRVVGCRDVTPVEFLEIHPDERLIEAVFQVSTFSNRENYKGMDLLYQFVSPNRSLQVVGYLPDTTMYTEYASNLAHSRTSEKGGGLGINVSAPVAEVVKLGADAKHTNKKISSIKYEKLPPMQILAASGTVNRGSGVYFKLKPSQHTTLEGSREYVLKMRVLQSWRGDVLRLQCRARRFKKGNLFSSNSVESSGSGDFLIALYLDHDPDAKRYAHQLADAEESLQKFANQFHSGANSISKLFDSKSNIPTNWISQILFDTSPQSLPAFAKKLPAPVRTAAIQFAVANTRLQKRSAQY